jgi:hypothetical protein
MNNGKNRFKDAVHNAMVAKFNPNEWRKKTEYSRM